MKLSLAIGQFDYTLQTYAYMLNIFLKLLCDDYILMFVVVVLTYGPLCSVSVIPLYNTERSYLQSFVRLGHHDE